MKFLALLWVVYVLTRKEHTIRNEDGSPYLTRYYLTGKWLRKWLDYNVFLHYFHSSDKREYHNHPWAKSVSLILWGGYAEFKPLGKYYQCRILRPGMLNRITKDDFHYVELLNEKRGCWTLFFAGNNPDQEWGFLLPDGTYESANDRFKDRESALSND